MAHVLCLVEARREWMDLFISDLTRRSYPYTAVNGQQLSMQVNPREVKLLDISIPEECIHYLMEDLAPCVDTLSTAKKKGWILSKLIRRLTGLKPLNHKVKPSQQIRKQWVNVLPIGWREDKVDPRKERPFLPLKNGGGELV